MHVLIWCYKSPVELLTVLLTRLLNIYRQCLTPILACLLLLSFPLWNISVVWEVSLDPQVISPSHSVVLGKLFHLHSVNYAYHIVCMECTVDQGGNVIGLWVDIVLSYSMRTAAFASCVFTTWQEVIACTCYWM